MLPTPRMDAMHTCCVAVDLTLCAADGTPQDMDTAFDQMTELSFHGRTAICVAAQSHPRHRHLDHLPKW